MLDLFAGSRGVSGAFVEAAKSWSLTFDIDHDPKENLLAAPLQRVIVDLVSSGAFHAMACGPVCSSFSTAITPAVRTREFPAGVPWCSEVQQAKNRDGNLMLAFVLRVVRACLRSKTFFFVENPDGSWLWKQQGALSWDKIMGQRRRFGLPG